MLPSGRYPESFADIECESVCFEYSLEVVIAVASWGVALGASQEFVATQDVSPFRELQEFQGCFASFFLEGVLVLVHSFLLSATITKEASYSAFAIG